MKEILHAIPEQPRIKVTRIVPDEAAYRDRLLRSRFGGSLPDVSDVVVRIDKLHRIFADIERATKGTFKRASLAKVQKVLDLGMGRGAVGGVIREFNPRVEITGVDDIEYHGGVFYDSYNHRVIGDIMSDQTWQFLASTGQRFDLVTGVGLPPDVIERIAANDVLPEVMKDNATALLVTDFYTNPARMIGFRHFKGSMTIDENIFVKAVSITLPGSDLY